MRDRKKRNIMIASLCCLLVFMGIGYALLSQTLNINETAKLTGSWNIYIDSITVSSKSTTANSVSSTVNEDKTGASFAVELLKPGDYVEYDIVIKNEGTINAVLRELIPNIESNNMDILLTHSIIQGQILKAKSETKFTLKVRFDERATEIVKEGKTSFDIQMVYEQYDGDAESIDPSIIPVTANDCFTIDDNGVITDYDYSCGTYVTVPAVVNDVTVTEISSGAFTTYNAILYFAAGSSLPSVVVAQDNDTYTSFQTLLEQMGGAEATGITLLIQGEELPDTTGLTMMKGNVDATGNMSGATTEVEYLDLSQASNLKIINVGAFLSSETNPSLKYLNLDGVKVETIGDEAFANIVLEELIMNTDLFLVLQDKFDGTIDKLKIYSGESSAIPDLAAKTSAHRIEINNLMIGEGITRIGNYAFSQQSTFYIKNVDLPESLLEIGTGSFHTARITGIELPSNLKKIENSAFEGVTLTSLHFPSKLESIGIETFDSLVTEQLIIPSSIKNIGSAAFQSMPSTSTITVNKAEGSFTTGDNWSGNAQVVYNP